MWAALSGNRFCCRVTREQPFLPWLPAAAASFLRPLCADRARCACVRFAREVHQLSVTGFPRCTGRGRPGHATVNNPAGVRGTGRTRDLGATGWTQRPAGCTGTRALGRAGGGQRLFKPGSTDYCTWRCLFKQGREIKSSFDFHLRLLSRLKRHQNGSFAIPGDCGLFLKLTKVTDFFKEKCWYFLN